MLKRGFDIIGSTLGLLLLLPVLIGCALAVRLDSRGPVLFRQERIGRYGRPFTILKFRT
jgi:lipopolysaccharide/colanic/teichoic acid biosynthesis glycosyltransferase